MESIFRTMGMFLFDTCSHKCSFCHFAETGKVLDAGQLAPYRNRDFIKRITDFFVQRSQGQKKWLFVLTGGEPLLMPNFETFCEPLIANGDKISLNTALLVGENSAAFRYLVSAEAGTEYLFASLHPETEIDDEDGFFNKVKMPKQAGHRVMVRYICHPRRLDRLQHVQNRCRELDICFSPSAMISPVYPGAYRVEEKTRIENYFTFLSQVVQMEGGVDTAYTRCWAGSRNFHADIRTGDIIPCATVNGPILGNIYENWLNDYDAPIAAPRQARPHAHVTCIFKRI
jgi:organic radical activating enzyme